MIGPKIVPTPNTAIACPCRSGGLICNRVACDSGMSPAPATPLQGAKDHQLAEAGGGAAQRRGDREADDRGEEDVFDAEPAGEPAGQRHHDRGADDVGGQRPGDLVERGRQASLDVRQGDVEDRVVDALHDVRQHDRDRDHAAVRNRGERVAPHRRCSRGDVVPAVASRSLAASSPSRVAYANVSRTPMAAPARAAAKGPSSSPPVGSRSERRLCHAKNRNAMRTNRSGGAAVISSARWRY